MNISLNGIKEIFSLSKKEPVNNLYVDRVWNDIETMPIWNWNKIVESGDLTHLFKNGKGLYSERLILIWMELQEQHLREFGIDDLLRNRIKIMTKLIKLNIKFIETRERNLLNFIEIAESQLKETAGTYTVRFYKVLDSLTTHKKMSIDPRTFPVIQWYHALKNMTSHGKND